VLPEVMLVPLLGSLLRLLTASDSAERRRRSCLATTGEERA
jgi:hypothetical protein